MSSWPSNLPQCPTLNGLSEQQQLNVKTFQPDVGPPKLRRRASGYGTMTKVVFRMTPADLAAFNAFYIGTLQDGTIQFAWRHPYDGNTYNWWFDAKSPPLIERVTNDTFQVSFPLLRIGQPPPQPPRSTFIGTGGMSASATVIARQTGATLQGAGNLVAPASAYRPAQATLAGAGALGATADQTGLKSAAATLAGSGFLSASTVSVKFATALLGGSGQLAAATAPIKFASANLAGSGSLSTALALRFDSTAVKFDSTAYTWDNQ